MNTDQKEGRPYLLMCIYSCKLLTCGHQNICTLGAFHINAQMH